ncbi:MAG: GNAT family N-acetyltransferase [Alphaproteobacteria bacterium]|nr:GNAT family N-acetyltransferase [Alphaproteobacteria bacterium]MDX5370470.1 GNAT family N-acetyltransferase [Alphaproteobacteria bacterium]MDX5464976.1 GNAT family N-acetyltransferase [Alphaproteobacteria bacterium]
MSRRSLARAVASPSVRVLVTAGAGPGGLGGAAVVFYRKGAGAARLYSIATAAAERGQGHGDALLAAVEADAIGRGCDRLRLEVRADNAVAADWYRRRAFQCCGRRAAYYEDGVDALVFEKRLG